MSFWTYCEEMQDEMMDFLTILDNVKKIHTAYYIHDIPVHEAVRLLMKDLENERID